MNKRSMVLAAMLAWALVVGRGAALCAEPVEIKAAWINTPASLIPIMFAHPGIALHDGVTYKFAPVYVANSPTQITAFAAGDLQVATLNFTSIPFAVLNAGINDLRIIADETQEGFADYATLQYAVLKDGPIKTVQDLKGKSIGVIGVGAATDIAMRAYLLEKGLRAPGDYTEVEVRPPNQVPMLEEHKVDAIGAGVPFTYTPEFLNDTRTLFTMKDAMHGSELSVWVAHASFIKAHRAALVDLLEDTVRAYRWFADPKNHAEAVAILSRQVKLPPEHLDWAFTKRDYYRDLDGVPNLDVLQRNVDTVKSLGFIKADVKVRDYADLSLVKEAAARLK
ncbi:MAG TPA: ABC transporter substrate-binding protein [Stellaceae bacterium]|nr:ABC transporter substrate-binding protein [Stellaceae bacterium]